MSTKTRKNPQNNKKTKNNEEEECNNTSFSTGAQQTQQGSFDFSAPPQHLDVLTKKIRAVKKKLRKIQETEKNLAAGKKLSVEQQRLLDEKVYHERSLKELDEIRVSLQDLDLTAQLRQLLGIFVAAANTSSPKLNDLAAVLLPPSVPETDFQPLRELEHACEIAQKFINGSEEELFSQPRVTYSELRAEVRTFLKNEALRTPPVPVAAPVLPDVQAATEVPPNGTIVVDQAEPIVVDPAASNSDETTHHTLPDTTSETSTSSPTSQTTPVGDETPASPVVQENGAASPKEGAEEEQVQKRKNFRNKPFRGRRGGRGSGRKDSDEKMNNSGDNQTNNPSDSNSKQSGRGGRGRGGPWRGGKSFSPKTGENKPAAKTGTKPPAKSAPTTTGA